MGAPVHEDMASTMTSLSPSNVMNEDMCTSLIRRRGSPSQLQGHVPPGELHIREILGGNTKTHLAVYEEGLFGLRGGAKPFRGGANAPSRPPP